MSAHVKISKLGLIPLISNVTLSKKSDITIFQWATGYQAISSKNGMATKGLPKGYRQSSLFQLQKNDKVLM